MVNKLLQRETTASLNSGAGKTRKMNYEMRTEVVVLVNRLPEEVLPEAIAFLRF